MFYAFTVVRAAKLQFLNDVRINGFYTFFMKLTNFDVFEGYADP